MTPKRTKSPVKAKETRSVKVLARRLGITLAETERLLHKLETIRRKTKEIGDARDVLRHELSDLKQIIESTGRGIDVVRNGVAIIDEGVDVLSEYV